MRSRLIVFLSLLVIAVSACSSPAPVTPSPAAQRIVVLDEYAALELVSIDVRPTLVFATLQSEIGQAALTAAGVPLQQEPSFLSAPDLEKVAAARPDVIVISGAGPLAAMVDKLSAVARTVVVPYSRPWREILTETAAAFGKQDAAAALITRIGARVADLKKRVDAKPVSLSVLLGYEGALYTVGPATPIAALLAETGFGRPAAQVDPPTPGDPTISPISPERLAEHNGDVVAVLAGTYYNAAIVRGLPTFGSLGATRAGRSVDVDGGSWFGSDPFAISWLLDDLGAIVDGTGQQGIGTLADATARWKAFSENR